MMHTTIDTPVGPFTIVGGDIGPDHATAVLAAGFTADASELLALVHPELRDAGEADLEPAVKATMAYFDGDPTAIDNVPVAQRGGEFLAQAWDVLRTVPAGAPVTYTEYARLAGRPAAVRAAAQACARNAAALFVPCHRVVRTDGTLGGYRWGLRVKRWLLDHERAAADMNTGRVGQMMEIGS
jgi:methylated-DNA-[protein]-cysteine S-methyltransferase